MLVSKKNTGILKNEEYCKQRRKVEDKRKRERRLLTESYAVHLNYVLLQVSCFHRFLARCKTVKRGNKHLIWLVSYTGNLELTSVSVDLHYMMGQNSSKIFKSACLFHALRKQALIERVDNQNL